MANKRNRLDDYELFFMEIPTEQELQDIQIIDVRDDSLPEPKRGLSDDQVSRISKDLDEPRPSEQKVETKKQRQLFDN